LNPSFTKTFVLDYHFEEVQHLKFDVYDIDNATASLADDDYIGAVVTTLAEICGSRGQRLIKTVLNQGRNYGTMIVQAEQMSHNIDDIKLQISALKLAKMDFFGKTDGWFEICRSTEANQFLPVYKSDVIHSNLNPSWAQFVVPLNQLCNGDLFRVLQFNCYDWNK
jgi:hypothetical protein